ncbi:MAG: PIN domain-containing protein [Candidatus Micrarchaeota archaeon]
MKLVADANVLFSAFLREGSTRRLWLDRRLEIYAPEFLLEEIKKHLPELARRAKLTPEGAFKLCELLLRKVKLVKTNELVPYAAAARHLTTDAKDEPYAACALATGAGLWSHDRKFERDRLRVWTTAELLESLKYER